MKADHFAFGICLLKTWVGVSAFDNKLKKVRPNEGETNRSTADFWEIPDMQKVAADLLELDLLENYNNHEPFDDRKAILGLLDCEEKRFSSKDIVDWLQ